jgi:carboxymethylenebutenolidase
MQSDRIEYPITTGQIRVVSQGNVLPAFWAYPASGGTFPGVVLLHDRAGLGGPIRRLARQLAQAGYYTIAPELFPDPATAAPDTRIVIDDDVSQNAIVAAACNALHTHNHCNRSIAVVGLGLGGTLALHAAAHLDDLSAAVAFEGTLGPYRALIATLAIPILGLYGVRDQPPEAVSALQAVLGQPDGPHQLVLYNQAGTAFYDEANPAYDPTATADAWQRVTAFLEAQLTAPSHAPGSTTKPL